MKKVFKIIKATILLSVLIFLCYLSMAPSLEGQTGNVGNTQYNYQYNWFCYEDASGSETSFYEIIIRELGNTTPQFIDTYDMNGNPFIAPSTGGIVTAGTCGSGGGGSGGGTGIGDCEDCYIDTYTFISDSLLLDVSFYCQLGENILANCPTFVSSLIDTLGNNGIGDGGGLPGNFCTTNPSDNDIWIYDAASSEFCLEQIPGGYEWTIQTGTDQTSNPVVNNETVRIYSDTDELTISTAAVAGGVIDVEVKLVGSSRDGDVLTSDAGQPDDIAWKPGLPLCAAAISTAMNNDILVFNGGSGEFCPQTPPSILNSCGTAPTDDQVMVYDAGSSLWCPEDPPTMNITSTSPNIVVTPNGNDVVLSLTVPPCGGNPAGTICYESCAGGAKILTLE